MTCYDMCRTPIGWCGVVATRSALRRIFLAEPDRESLLETISGQFPGIREDTAICRQTLDFLTSYFESEACAQPAAQLEPGDATDFQRRVWDVTRTVVFGQVRTYAWVAERIGCPGASRAVGTALGRNPVPLIVPCHRIVRSDGRLGGFSATGGVALKRMLLEHEGVKFDSSGRVVYVAGC